MRANKDKQEEFRNKLTKASRFLRDDISMPEECRLLKDLAILLVDIEYRSKTNKSLSLNYHQQAEREHSLLRENRLTLKPLRTEDGGYSNGNTT